MRVIGIREGFATNSSTPHMLVFRSANEKTQYGRDGTRCRPGYQPFRIADRESKLYFFASMLICVSPDAPDKLELLRKVFREEDFRKLADSLDELGSSYVADDQCLGVPVTVRGAPCYEFWSELVYSVIDADGLCLYGDNMDWGELEDDGGSRLGAVLEWPIMWIRSWRPPGCGPDVVRREPYGWCVLNRANGTKLRLASDALLPPACAATASPDAPELVTDRPELVEAKITDMCSAGCPFCYQSSAPDGGHADIGGVRKIIDVLADLEVLEVALGGGEPTGHPHLFDIVAHCKKRGIVANLCTKDYSWLGSEACRDILRTRSVGGIAVSVGTVDDVHAAIAAASGLPEDHRRVLSFHYILGMRPIEELYAVHEALTRLRTSTGATLVLLGHKPLGRAAGSLPIHYADDWLGQLMKHSLVSIAVDTVLAEEYRHLLEEHHVDPRRYVLGEGVFSKYVDAVQGLVGDSSYAPETFRAFSSREELRRYLAPTRSP